MSSESLGGQILVGVTVAAIVGIGGWVLGRATAPAEPPSLEITPESVTAQVGLDTEFNAIGGPDVRTLTWRVAGQPVGRSHVAQCDAVAAQLMCRFLVPGTYSVSATATAANDLEVTRHSSVSVVFPDRYYTVFIQNPDRQVRSDAYRVLLRRIDWARVQQSITPLILLYDPDKGRNVFAADTVFEPEFEGVDVLQGLKLRIPKLTEPARGLVVGPLEALGVTVTEIPYAEAILSIERGAIDGGFVTLGDPTIDLLDADLEDMQAE
ncbi:MAG: hypothetical protein HOY44_20140 [Maritimibacter sp.]|jgi:hypothetical protein|uniref:hypothetical protein n=1 Tax=Maritimibacter sp. TaxID=2003363 RepID=UPI001D70F6C2|nr:hypothetical protein [Maritimibacter sp.]MBL6429841.1 hypothetical protein [Maritimibacter sp.]